MTDKVRVKICGLTDVGHIQFAVAAGAGYIGLNFIEKSPRFVSVQLAKKLADTIPPGVAKVALTMNAGNDVLDKIVDGVALDILQLHGNETPERVAEVKSRYGLPVMKALGVGGEEDLPALLEFGRVADQLLVDAKPPKNAELLGGNGLAFDWRLIAGRRWPVPWMLAGGLNAQNVAEAVHLTGASQVDVSSGVESAPGIKDESKIAGFIKSAWGEL